MDDAAVEEKSRSLKRLIDTGRKVSERSNWAGNGVIADADVLQTRTCGMPAYPEPCLRSSIPSASSSWTRTWP
jgi:hypothetical protein